MQDYSEAIELCAKHGLTDVDATRSDMFQAHVPKDLANLDADGQPANEGVWAEMMHPSGWEAGLHVAGRIATGDPTYQGQTLLDALQLLFISEPEAIWAMGREVPDDAQAAAKFQNRPAREVATDASPGDVLRLRDYAMGAVMVLRVIGRTESPQHPMNLTVIRLRCVLVDDLSAPTHVQIGVPMDPKVPVQWGDEVDLGRCGVVHSLNLIRPAKADRAPPNVWPVTATMTLPNGLEVQQRFWAKQFDSESPLAFEDTIDLANVPRVIDDSIAPKAAPAKPPKTVAEIADELSIKASILEARLDQAEKYMAEMSALPKLADPGYPEWANVPDSGEILALGEGISYLNCQIDQGHAAEASSTIDYIVAALRRIQHRLGGERQPNRMYGDRPFDTEICASIRPSGVTWAQAEADGQIWATKPIGECLQWASNQPGPCTLLLVIRDGELEIELADVEAGQIALYDGMQPATVAELTPEGVVLATAPSFVPWWRVFAGTVAFLRRDPPDQAEAVGGQL